MPKALMIHTEATAVGLYRIWTPAKYLRKMGWEVVEMDRTDGSVDLKVLEQYLEGVDIIIVQRMDDLHGAAALIGAAREIAKCPLVIDIDDNIFDVSPNSPSYEAYQPGAEPRNVAIQMIQWADAVTVSTPALKEAYAPYNDNIFVLQNYQDMDDWIGIKRPQPGSRFVIGWAGSSSHYDDLKLIEQPIKRILRKNPDVVFRILGLMPDFLEGVAGVEFRNDWVDIQHYPAKLAELNFDVGLVPLTDTAFNRGKSNIKWQEYSMLEIPTIASKVGEYRRTPVVQTAFLANTSAQWEKYLQHAIDSFDRLSYWGVPAKKRIQDEYDIAINIKDWHATYTRIITAYNAGLH